MTVNYRRSVNGSNDQLGRKYLTDSVLNGYWGYWTSTAGVISTSFVDKMPGDAIHSIYANTMGTGRFDFTFNEPKNLHTTVIDFWAKASNFLAILIYTWDVVGFGASYTRRDVNLTPSWARYIAPIDTAYSASAGGAARENTIVRCKTLGFYNNGVQSDIYFSGMTIRRQ